MSDEPVTPVASPAASPVAVEPPRPRGSFPVDYLCPKCGPFEVYHSKPTTRNVWCQWCRSLVKIVKTPETTISPATDAPPLPVPLDIVTPQSTIQPL